ncbi:hypothetical protein [Streptomyces sp. Wb2n-11]|uniref:hypothetical protein n=1 Tax=Streptomyces sp. Wb2n-11 TaxID=1030533 RepID=UPI000B845340|nr:hypothetical protein [Streptomyces sp. Wb2n-11]
MSQHAAPEITPAPEILARLDRIAAERHVTGPGLSHAEHTAAALVIADHYTDGGTRKTTTGLVLQCGFVIYPAGSPAARRR